jgi:hypothetical protein
MPRYRQLDQRHRHHHQLSPWGYRQTLHRQQTPDQLPQTHREKQGLRQSLHRRHLTHPTYPDYFG